MPLWRRLKLRKQPGSRPLVVLSDRHRGSSSASAVLLLSLLLDQCLLS
jgi:hypothetical protein